MKSHSAACQAVASGIHSVPETASAFASTQAAYRFFKNPRIKLPDLAAPLIEFARQEALRASDAYLLVVHDWSQLMYPDHTRKTDRVALSSRGVPEGYELQTSLLVSDRDGSPIAPLTMSLRAEDGVHCSREWKVRAPLSPLDELDPAMSYTERLSLGRPIVHLIDAEADSVGHFRVWEKQLGRLYVVRGDDRLVEHHGQEKRCSAIQEKLRRRGAFRDVREVLYRGRKARQWIAEVPIWLRRPAQRNRPKAGDRRRIPGPPVALRLVICEVRTPTGALLATWFLLTNVPSQVDAATIALWYYWRWTIEQFFKLLKSAGIQLEQWQQESAAAVARRLLVACMACVTVWRLARSEHPQAKPARQLLVRLSGRQMAHDREFTLPALMAGMWCLLAMFEVIEHYEPKQFRELRDFVLAHFPVGPP